jgi:hypothetical protein
MIHGSRYKAAALDLLYFLTGLLALVPCPRAAVVADHFAALCADRAAIERVYYGHRTGPKPPFQEALPADQLRRLVLTDLAKEAALKKVYGVEVTPAMLAAEVQRINTTTRTPEILAELKAALGNDTNRFARTVAKPIVVERLLRNRFENDDELHAQLAAARTPQEKTALDRQIAATDTQIDRLVYDLYGLTEDEIKIVEECRACPP